MLCEHDARNVDRTDPFTRLGRNKSERLELLAAEIDDLWEELTEAKERLPLRRSSIASHRVSDLRPAPAKG